MKKPRPRPGTFDLLGFTHYWARSRRGNWVIKRKTAKDRQSRILRAFNQWCRANRHKSVPQQWEALSRKLRGVYAYYGIIGNIAALQSVQHKVRKLWQKWLNRRSQKGRMPWARFNQLLKAFPLPKPRRMAAV
ncbi:hypothetical protein [Halorhodospira halophila]|uniref:hypothetical protein n=1 Tax=Halorhodospira halophila TaxID=1053 RepID=UPI0019145EFE|nr:hypothetical protein [Halorhodospira halophila]MBK5937575.1 hypothetical protein [Halorhodospira halophila]